MLTLIHRFLRARMTDRTARLLLTMPFWLSGFAKLFAFDRGAAEMSAAGLEPAIAFNIATVIVQLLGSAVIVANRCAWLGAGALGVFTGLTIFLVHHFWTLTEEPFRTIALHVSAEHVGIIGGLLGIAILSSVREASPERRPAQTARAA